MTRPRTRGGGDLVKAVLAAVAEGVAVVSADGRLLGLGARRGRFGPVPAPGELHDAAERYGDRVVLVDTGGEPLDPDRLAERLLGGDETGWIELTVRAPDEALAWRACVGATPFRADPGDADGGTLLSIEDASGPKEGDGALEFRATFELSGIGKAQLDPATGRFTRVNRRLCTMLGYREEELLAMTFLDVTAPEDRADNESVVRPFLEGVRGEATVEKRYLRKDGTPLWVLVTATMITDDAGRPWRTVSDIQDITERREAEAALRASEARYRALVEAGGAAVWCTDPAGELTWTTPHFARLTGLSPERARGRGWLDAIHPADREAAERAWSRALRERTPYDVTIRLLDGPSGHRWVHSRAVPVFDAGGDVKEWMGSDTDITAEREAQERMVFLTDASRILGESLDEAETLARMARLVVPALADGCMVDLADDEGRLDRVVVHHRDPATVRLAAELHARYPRDPDADVGPHRALRDGATLRVDGVGEAELGAFAEDERHLELLRGAGLNALLFVPLLHRGRALGVLTLVRGDPDRPFGDDEVALVEELARRAAVAVDNAALFRTAQELNEFLERRVEERTRALERANLRLATINEELEAFTYSTSHDLRAPLRGIDGFSHALIEDYGAAFDDTGRRYLTRIREGAQRMGQLIDDMLALSRIGRSTLRVESVDLSAMVRGLLDELREDDPARPVEVEVEDGLVATGDRSLLRVVFDNLLANAWKFTRDRRPARISVTSVPGDGGRAIAVRDNGTGFDMDYAGRLFVPFQRLHDEGTFEGSGIGLATVHRVVIRHGGRIWAEAAPDEGATFFLTLPEPDGEIRQGDG